MLWLCALLAGCSAGDGGREPNVRAFIANWNDEQPIAHLLVTVDGEALFDGVADFERRGSWIVRETTVGNGEHRVDALERATGTHATASFSMAKGGERSLVIDYLDPDDRGGPAISIQVHHEQLELT